MKIAMIRIRGLVNVERKTEDTLEYLRLRRKNACVVVENKQEILGMIKKVVNYVAFGEIDKETLKLLLERRAVPKIKIDDKKIDEFLAGKITLKQLGIKPFFRLHPPRGGFKSTKLPYPRGVLGNHRKEINKLIVKML